MPICIIIFLLHMLCCCLPLPCLNPLPRPTSYCLPLTPIIPYFLFPSLPPCPLTRLPSISITHHLLAFHHLHICTSIQDPSITAVQAITDPRPSVHLFIAVAHSTLIAFPPPPSLCHPDRTTSQRRLTNHLYRFLPSVEFQLQLFQSSSIEHTSTRPSHPYLIDPLQFKHQEINQACHDCLLYPV